MKTTGRPLSLTILGVYFAIGAAAAFISPLWLLWDNPVIRQAMEEMGQSAISVVVWSLLGAALSGACAYAVLRGRRWGRHLYLVMHPVLWIVQGLLYRFPRWSLALGVVVYAIAVFLMFRAPAREYFAAPDLSPEETRLREAASPRMSTSLRVRKILSLPLFALGEQLLFTFCAMWYTMVRMSLLEWDFPLFFVLPGLVLLAGALALWGWRRWRMVAGVILVAIGAEAIFVPAGMAAVWYSPEFHRMLTEQEHAAEFLHDACLALLWSALVTLPPGILLILRQRKADRQAASAAPVTSP